MFILLDEVYEANNFEQEL